MRTHFLALSLYFSYFCGEKVQTEIISTMRKKIYLLEAALLLLLVACGQRGQYDAQFARIDSLADVRPELADSSLQTLAPAMDKTAKADTMHYALLRLKTDDKLYLNITDRCDLALRLVDYYGHHNKSLLPTALFYAGRVCADLGDAPQALEYYQKALDVQQGENMGGILHEQMGYIFYYQGFFTQALDHFKLSYQCRRASNDTIGSIYNLRDIANSYLQMQKLDSCEANLRKALSLVECIDNKELHANILSQLARLYNKKQMYVQARDIIMPLLENCTDSMNLSAYYSTAATAYSHLGNVDSTRMLCMKLMDVGNKYGRQFASKQLADISFSNHNVADALRYTKLYEQFTDSIHKADNAKAVTQMDAMYNYQLHVDEKHRIEKEKQRGEAIFSMAVFGLAALLLFVGYRYKAKINEAQSRYERLLLMEKENSLLRGDRSKAANPEHVVAGMDYFQTTNIWRRLQELQTSADTFSMKLTQEEWEELKSEINAAWPLFMDKLHSLYPNLNMRQLQVCLLTKIGLKPKLVAELVDLSEQGVGSLKRRLYEKAFNKSGGTKDFDSSILLI